MISSQHHFLKPLIRNNRKVHSHSNNSWTTHHACPRSCRNAEENWIWLLLSRLPCEWGGSDAHCLRPQSSGHYFLQPSRELLRQRVWEKKTEKAEGREGGRQWPAGLDSKLPPSEDCKGCTFVTNMAPCVSEDTANHIPSTEISERPTVSNELHGRKSSAQENIYITISVMCCGLYLYLQTKTSSCLDNWPRKFAPKGLISRENILYPQN